MPWAASDILLLYIRMAIPGGGGRPLGRLRMGKDAVFTEDFIPYRM
jgi:hypothetical protein